VTVFTFLVCALAAWRLAHMFTLERGPFDVFQRLRAHTTLGGVLDCVYCLSVWTALLFISLAMFAWDSAAVQVFVYALAASGAALMLGAYSMANLK
jgi:hypothetical protein